MPLIVQALDIETVETVDPGCNLVAAVVNFLYSYKTNFYEICSTTFQRTGLENKLASSIEKLDLGKFDTKKQKRKVNNSCTIAVSCQCTLTK